MFGDLDVLYYFDEMLIRQLGSFVIEGYVDIITQKCIRDKTLTGSANTGNSNSKGGDCRNTKDEKDGYKSLNATEGDTFSNNCDNRAGIEDREFVRREDEIKRVYTSFNIYKNVMTTINSTNKFRPISERDIIANNIKDGEIVGLECFLTDICPHKCVQTIADTLNALGKDLIKDMLGDKQGIGEGKLNVDKMFSLINLLYNKLNSDTHHDIVVRVSNTLIMLCVNSSSYSDNRNSLINGCGCRLKVIGKVVKNCNRVESFNLFRKLGECNFYDKMLENILEDIKIINKECNLYMPTNIIQKVDNIGAIIMPMTMFN
ncbi:MAG: hypothetical protein ACRC7N_01995 [Clostridium sp.]